jgi:hypothetical protein
MELLQDMEFKVTQKFIPNFCNAKTLRILDIQETTVRIEMEDARSRGVFPKLQFLSLIKNGALVFIEETLTNQEDTA